MDETGKVLVQRSMQWVERGNFCIRKGWLELGLGLQPVTCCLACHVSFQCVSRLQGPSRLQYPYLTCCFAHLTLCPPQKAPEFQKRVAEFRAGIAKKEFLKHLKLAKCNVSVGHYLDSLSEKMEFVKTVFRETNPPKELKSKTPKSKKRKSKRTKTKRTKTKPAKTKSTKTKATKTKPTKTKKRKAVSVGANTSQKKPRVIITSSTCPLTCWHACYHRVSHLRLRLLWRLLWRLLCAHVSCVHTSPPFSAITYLP